MATREEVKSWFESLDPADQAKVNSADQAGIAAAASVKGMLVAAGLIDPAATDGQVIETLKMRH
jgi:hypothetical protein